MDDLVIIMIAHGALAKLKRWPSYNAAFANKSEPASEQNAPTNSIAVEYPTQATFSSSLVRVVVTTFAVEAFAPRAAAIILRTSECLVRQSWRTATVSFGKYKYTNQPAGTKRSDYSGTIPWCTLTPLAAKA